MGVRLPAEYQEVEYISGTGIQYIDSGIECTSDLIVDFSFSSTSGGNKAVCGGLGQSSGNAYFRHHCSPEHNGKPINFYWIQNSSVDQSSVQFLFTAEKRYYTYINPVTGRSTINGTEFTFTPLPSGLTTGKNYGILGRISYSGAIQAKPSTFYYFKFYRNDALIGDFIPCYRKSDNKPGMYDLVSGTFFTNAGTGDFIVGPDVIGKVDRALMLRRRGLMHNVSRYIYEASNLSFNGKSDCINTGVYLFTQKNIDRDFEFIAEGIVGNGNTHTNDSTIICAKYDTGALGFLVRPTGGTSLNYNGTIFVKRNTNSTVIVRRINGVITLSGTNITNPRTQFTNAVFNHPLVFGCALKDDGTPYRYCPGTIAHVTVRWL